MNGKLKGKAGAAVEIQPYMHYERTQGQLWPGPCSCDINNLVDGTDELANNYNRWDTCGSEQGRSVPKWMGGQFLSHTDGVREDTPEEVTLWERCNCHSHLNDVETIAQQDWMITLR